MLITALKGIALAAVAWGQAEQAIRLLGAAEALADRFGVMALIPTDRIAHERSLAAARVILGETGFAEAWAAGRRLTAAEATTEVGLVRLPEDATVGDQGGIRLSARERQVLQLLAAGAPDREIAVALFLSVRTVEAHVSRIRSKLCVHTRTAAVATAIAARLIEPVDVRQP